MTSEESKAWNEGYDAYNFGQGKNANPYKLTHEAWLRGWLLAQDDARPATS